MIAVTIELQDEHDFISRVNSFIKNYDINNEDLNKLNSLLKILKEFVGNCHHKKEEIFIFPYLINKGGDEASLANKMIDEHRIIENLESQLELNINKRNFNDTKNILNDLTSILDSHIQEENTVVFSYAEFIIDDTTKEKLIREMSQYENNTYYCNKEKYENILQSIVNI
ncbi:hypothetical protein Calag_0854 [Caldisphaera lagunensis DSM 15908]|uniref:Hemerythrin-like domain-containing protein n=1 Tax=Caldisphaera lagunensis (strain DSM 15908 / JCM 11604 / ANMR 0165 / IC-154) TaxID=1056495 RepID=L0AC45_CALLD|nr:hemerythrin domain-containing protein [Caldisphaera lagunensis]AFZ70595.1 hypothetical protein Calag_0854 [Caldisphaera lagunensis DSM 15908]